MNIITWTFENEYLQHIYSPQDSIAVECNGESTLACICQVQRVAIKLMIVAVLILAKNMH